MTVSDVNIVIIKGSGASQGIMAKTKTFGVRLTPDLIAELERLKDAFAFASYGEMLESWIRLMQSLDETVGGIDKHPREWGAHEMKSFWGQFDCSDPSSSAMRSVVLRRLKERFGEDGVQRIQVLLAGTQGEPP